MRLYLGKSHKKSTIVWRSRTCHTRDPNGGSPQMTLRLIGIALLAASGLFADVVTNGSFETPALGPSGFLFLPSGATWTFSGRAGIQANGSELDLATAPDGIQTA